MADVSIANLPVFAGSAVPPGALFAIVDVADTSESPQGTTKKATTSQVFANYPSQVHLGSVLIIGTDPGGSDLLRVGGSATVQGLTVLGNVGMQGTVGSGPITVTNPQSSPSLTLNTSVGAGVNYMIAMSRGGVNIGWLAADPSDNLVIMRGVDGAVSATINHTTGNWSFAQSVAITGGLSLPFLAGGAQTVGVGAADSGGVGFRMLRVPN